MKPRSSARLALPLATAITALLGGQSALATPYYWDVNGATAGFSTVAGAWNTTSAFWNTNSTGGSGTLVAAPTTADDLNIKTATTNTGSITDANGTTRLASSLTFVSGVGAVTISSTANTPIQIGGTGTSSGVFNNSASSQNINVGLLLNSANTNISVSTSAAGALKISGVTGLAGSGVTQTLNIGASAAGAITLSGAIADSAAGGKVALNVNSSGAGVATLQSTNTYSGGTTLVAGTLAANTTGALPGYNTSGSVTFSGGALQVPLSAWATSDIDTLLSNATKTSGKLGLDTTNGDLTQWTAFTTSNLGGLGLQKAGTNVLILNQANTYTGSTAITGGTLRVDTGGNLNGASNIALSTGAALVFNTSSDVAITGAITGGTQNTANVTQQGGGKLTLSGNNGFLGKLVVSNGTVSIATWNSGTNAGPLGGTQGGTQGQTELGGGSGTTGTLLYTGGSAASNKVLYLTPGGTGVINIDNGSTVMNLSLTTGTSVQISGSGNLVKAGPGTLVLSNNYSTYSGSTTINAGTLQVDGKSPAASTVAVTTNGTLSGGGTILGNSTLTGNGIINLSSSGSIAGTLGVTGGNWNGAGSVGGVVNSSSGTFTIGSAGNLTASSGLSVTGGTTLVNGTLTGGVSVSPGATLGGAGSITGLVSVNGNLSPGASIAKLESGAVTFGTGSTFTYEINHLAAPSAAGDLQVVHGDSLATNLSLSGTVNLVLTDLAGPTGTFAANTSLSLIQYAGGWNGGFFTYQGTTLGNDQPFIDANGNHWKITYDSAGGGLNFATALAGSHFITLSNLTAVPEPGSLLALGCLIGSGALLRRRAR